MADRLTRDMVPFHELKTWPEYFGRVWDRKKRCELRKDDRDFRVGDPILLEEYEPHDDGGGEYSGREVEGVITDVVRNAPEFGLMPGYCIFSFDETARRQWRRDEP